MTDEGESYLALPPSPRCARCGHQLCPFCAGPACDLVLPWLDHELCCAGECDVPRADFEQWQRDIQAVLTLDDGIVDVAEGPWFPMSERSV